MRAEANGQWRGAAMYVDGAARIDRRTKNLIKRIQPGEIAIIDHGDIDRVAAEGLIRAKVGAVVNAAASISGRYPNTGPLLLVLAGIPLVDDAGPEVLEAVQEGDAVQISNGEVRRGGELVATGTALSEPAVRIMMRDAHESITEELERFATNTLEYISREASLTFAPIELPPLRTSFEGRHALVVVRGHEYESDLAALRSYIREFRPVLIGVDGGADALLEVKLRPDIIIGDFDSLSEHAVQCGAELVHHVHLDGRAPGREELQAWGVPYEEFIVDGMSEDVAMLLAFEAGARLIVAVGTHSTMVEFLDKGRAGMASTFLTRMRLGPVVVDAKGVSRLYQGGVRRRDLAMLVGAALLAVIVIATVSEPVQVFMEGIRLTIRELWYSITKTLF